MTNHIDAHIGEKIRHLRSRKRLSHADLGAAADVTADEIAAFECGTNRIPAPTLLVLCRALDTNPDALFEGLREGGDEKRRGSPLLDRVLREHGARRSA